MKSDRDALLHGRLGWGRQSDCTPSTPPIQSFLFFSARRLSLFSFCLSLSLLFLLPSLTHIAMTIFSLTPGRRPETVDIADGLSHALVHKIRC